MLTRRYRVQEKRQARKGLLMFIGAGILLLVLLSFGIPILARFAAFISDLRESSTPIVLEDKTPPAPPVFESSLPLKIDQPKVKLELRAEAGSTLKVLNNGKVIKETIVDETSKFWFETTLEKGENFIQATATDKAGNESWTASQKVYYDTEPPELEISTPSDGTNLFGKEKTITVEGKTETNATVTVNERQARVDSEGNFTLEITLNEGENLLVVKAIDPAGNETEKTISVSYTP